MTFNDLVALVADHSATTGKDMSESYRVFTETYTLVSAAYEPIAKAKADKAIADRVVKYLTAS